MCGCACMGVCVRVWVCVCVCGITVNPRGGDPIATLSLSKGPVWRLRKVLCSDQRGCCSLVAVSCLCGLCLGRGKGRRRGSGRTERLVGPCCLELQCRLVAGPCTYEHHYGKSEATLITTQQDGIINTENSLIKVSTLFNPYGNSHFPSV